MANLVQIWKMMDGDSHVTLHCFLRGDPADAELTNYVLLDPFTDLTPPMPRKQNLILKQIWYELNNFSITLAFEEQDGSWPFWTLNSGASLHHDWRFFGGIRDRSAAVQGMVSTGRLLMSTVGLTEQTIPINQARSGTLILWLEKRNRPNPQPN